MSLFPVSHSCLRKEFFICGSHNECKPRKVRSHNLPHKYVYSITVIQQMLKLLYKGLVSDLAFSHHQALSKEKSTENFTSAVLNGDLLFILILKKCRCKIFCIFVLGQDLMMAPSQSRMDVPLISFFYIPFVLFFIIAYMVVCFVCFCLILYICIIIMYSYCYIYVFLLLCMFGSGNSVSLCCSVYCLCVTVYCTTATGCQPNCS